MSNDDLTYFVAEEPDVPPAGVQEAHLYVWSGEPGPAVHIPVALIHDGDGGGTIEPTGPPTDCTVIDTTDAPGEGPH